MEQKKAVDYLRNRDKEEVVDEKVGDAESVAVDKVAYVTVEPNEMRDFLDKSFVNLGGYVPTCPPKVFEYQDEQFMVMWTKDNKKDKNQMIAFNTPIQSLKWLPASAIEMPQTIISTSTIPILRLRSTTKS